MEAKQILSGSSLKGTESFLGRCQHEWWDFFGTILAVNYFCKKGSVDASQGPEYTSIGGKAENYEEAKKFRLEIIIYNCLLTMDFHV